MLGCSLGVTSGEGVTTVTGCSDDPMAELSEVDSDDASEVAAELG